MRLDTVRNTLPHYAVNQTGCLWQKISLLLPLVQYKPSKILALFQFLVLELNSRDKTTVGPAVLCFMEINYFAALIYEVNWLLCGIVALFFTGLLVSENFPCSHHLSQDSDENVTDHLTAQCTLPRCPEGCVFCNCRTQLFS